MNRLCVDGVNDGGKTQNAVQPAQTENTFQ